jgi:hypothetical protein
LQGHGELHAMLNEVDRGLDEVDSLARATHTVDQKNLGSDAPLSAAPDAPEPTQSQVQQPDTGSTGDPQWQRQWVEREGEPTEHPAPKIPQLPEIESPAYGPLKPFPERHLPSLPPVSGYIKNPPGSAVSVFPESEILWLPNSGKFFGKPQSGVFFRRPGEEKEEDYAYPDRVSPRRSTPGERYAVQLNRLLPAPEEESGFNPGAVPVGEALRELAAVLNTATQRMTELDGAYNGADGLEERTAALRARILKLRARIANALALYENYTRALALDELDRRQLLLEDLLEQASLELAKTYDQSSDR